MARAKTAPQLVSGLQRLRESREHALRRLRIEHAPASHGPEVYEFLYPERARIEDVDAFIEDVLGA